MVLDMTDIHSDNFDVFDVLFNREIDDSNLIMATGESLAHLNCLYYRGMIKKSLDQNNQCWYEQS